MRGSNCYASLPQARNGGIEIVHPDTYVIQSPGCARGSTSDLKKVLLTHLNVGGRDVAVLAFKRECLFKPESIGVEVESLVPVFCRDADMVEV